MQYGLKVSSLTRFMKLSIMMFWRFTIIVVVGLNFYAEGQVTVIKDYNPGSCDEQSHGKEVLVKDRSSNDKILVCVKENSNYQWKSVDGSSTLGEFINPGYDCSDVLNHNPMAKDGFYWINLKSLKAKRVWCDMSTDGGGFILVGRKTTPKTWTLPSNADPVDIDGTPHWSSSLGDVPIMDFRVQIATRDSLKATKAHWFYRFKTTRPLKELMQKSNECGWSSAGIADVAFVKDLQTDTVVSHTFTCSKFGFGHHSSTGIGWASMNQCLKTACPWGYARTTNSSQNDYHGSFSYSAVQEISGMEQGATAFVGCDGSKCCGCFGPVGGRKNYCLQNCNQAINGGTVTDQVFTWFWVRPGLPNVLWKKCMNYKIKTANGKYTWFKLVNGSSVPVRGRCNERTVNLLDGVAVVPKGKSIQNISAMLAYRKEDKQMYLRSNGSWTALAQRDKILKELPGLVKPSLLNIESKIEKETSKKVDMQVKPKLDELSKRLDAQNISLSRRFEEIENEIQDLKNDLASLKTTSTPTPRRAECTLSSRLVNSGGYSWLNESSRNKDYTASNDLCDRNLLGGWYRFGGRAGTQIATACVPTKRCGTHATGWMTGVHPTEAEGKVSRTVGFNWSGNCLKWTQNIQVINCGAFYVYNLSPPSACSLRYCGSS